MKLLTAVCIAAIIYLWLIHPRISGERRRRCRSLGSWNYAHRGLWSRAAGIPENSMEAFSRAVSAGYGIELDVHMTADGRLVVFHDEELRRMCGVEGEVEEKTLPELQELRLGGTGHGIPLLSSVLEMVKGRVPLLIELKVPTADISMCPRVWAMLKDYEGDFLIESFNPLAVRWFRRNCPDVIAGQLSARYAKEDKNTSMMKFCSTTLLMNTISRPDFISYNCRHTDVIGYRLNRRFFRVPVFLWTIRTEEDYEECLPQCDGIIFERFLPPAHRSMPKEKTDEDQRLLL